MKKNVCEYVGISKNMKYVSIMNMVNVGVK